MVQGRGCNCSLWYLHTCNVFYFGTFSLLLLFPCSNIVQTGFTSQGIQGCGGFMVKQCNSQLGNHAQTPMKISMVDWECIPDFHSLQRLRNVVVEGISIPECMSSYLCMQVFIYAACPSISCQFRVYKVVFFQNGHSTPPNLVHKLKVPVLLVFDMVSPQRTHTFYIMKCKHFTVSQ